MIEKSWNYSCPGDHRVVDQCTAHTYVFLNVEMYQIEYL